jgi:hypothetical protein
VSRSVRFKLRGGEEKLALDMCAQLGTPLDTFAYQLYRSGMRLLLQEVARRKQELDQQAVQEYTTEISDDMVHTGGDSGDTDTESSGGGPTTEVPMEPKNYSVENV